jgi:hypothetical protein
VNREADPAIEQAIARELGHMPPTTAAERDSITVLSVERARDLSGLAQYLALRTLILTGCDPVSLTSLAGLGSLVNLKVTFSGLKDLVGVAELPALLILTVPTNLVQDLTPVLGAQRIRQMDVVGNPLSDESYYEILPQLKRQGCQISASDEREWQITRRMHTASYPFSFYTTEMGSRLARPGLELTSEPELKHPFVSSDELETLLDQDPDQLPTLFQRPELLMPAHLR